MQFVNPVKGYFSLENENSVLNVPAKEDLPSTQRVMKQIILNDHMHVDELQEKISGMCIGEIDQSFLKY